VRAGRGWSCALRYTPPLAGVKNACFHSRADRVRRGQLADAVDAALEPGWRHAEQSLKIARTRSSPTIQMRLRFSRCFPAIPALWLSLASGCQGAQSPRPSQTDAGRTAASASATPLRVMSFNLRYDNPRDGVNAWPNRRDWVAKLIQFHGADVVGVQEALAPMLSDLDARLTGFARVGVGRADGRSKGEFSAILYRTARLALLDSGTFWLSPTPEVAGSKGWDAAIERVATWARFRDRLTGCSHLQINTHFDHMGEQARQESARLIRRRLPALAAGLPVVMTGDLNADPTSASYRILTTDQVPDAGAPLADGFTVSRTGHYGPTSSWTAFRAIEPGRRIDYVLVSAPVSVLSHGILPDSWDGRFPSDHLPVLASLVPSCR
jgi:endonuclease/exonuclease/phosphatase family metal-dependent hydrolase